MAGVFDAEHQRVANCLDLRSSESGQLGSDGVTEVGHQSCGLFVAVRLGESGEAGDVGKQERRRGGVKAVSRMGWRGMRHQPGPFALLSA